MLELSCSFLRLHASRLLASLVGLLAFLLGLHASYLYCSPKSLSFHSTQCFPFVVLQSVPTFLHVSYLIHCKN
ncbi:hypothetical protein PRUPE_5G036700 [Prunus persica]|uniref:Uncharacterized protein n=1 Tax=Prunus persica TaxID=3760 RepID=A0A251P399_PRUPE|nr:hypothetical protein PRUPE_5G036700 [Prunus persica]